MFVSPTLGLLDINRVAEEIIKFIEQEPDRFYRLVIGTDSEGRIKEADFVSAIVIHCVGSGGRYFWRRSHSEKRLTLRERMYQEAMNSIELCQEFLEVFKTKLKGKMPKKFEIELHIDIGENGETRSMIKEIVGMVRAYGLSVRTKPESYAASSVADRHT
jgi:predicted RNase H-related nuclease YkuK (DUF458 family)